MSLTDFAIVSARSFRTNGVRAGLRTLAREMWHSWRRLYHNGEAVHRLKWYLPHHDPAIAARGYEATVPATNFSEFHVADVFEERYLVHEFLRFVRPDDVFWDVGANIGLWTLLVGQAAGETLAFEPDARVAPHLEKNVKHNGVDARVLWLGLSEENIIVEREVNHRWGTDPADLILRRAEHLIDGVMADDGPLDPPDVMKVDVEGAELGALRGLGDHLADVRHLLVEVHPQFMDEPPERVREHLEATHTVDRVNDRGGEFHLEARRREGDD